MSKNPDRTKDDIESATAAPALWRRVSTTQTMYDGTILPTWGVQESTTQRWVGKAHPVDPSPKEKAEAYANAGLFAASKDMAALLEEAVEFASAQFDETDPASLEISGGDFLDWFAQWRQKAKQVPGPLSVRLPSE